MNKEQLFEFHIRNNWFKISRFYNQLASKYGLSFSWGFILLNVERKGTPSTALGPRMGMEPTSLSRTLKNMEESGYIVRKTEKTDKRKSIVFLTKQGIEMRRKVKTVVVEFNTALYDQLPKDEVESFFKVMQTIDTEVDRMLENINNANL